MRWFRWLLEEIAIRMNSGRPIHITLEGGIVQSIRNIPVGLTIEVYDYDVDSAELSHPSIVKDSEGNLAFLTIWDASDDSTHALRGDHR